MTRIARLIALALAFVLPQAATAHPHEAPTITLAELKDKYALPNSRFVDIDGVNVHYVDEGSGPPVVLLHASYHNLLAWNGVAEALKRNHRVIRFDFPGNGLTGFETKPVPEGGYLLTDRNIDIMEGLVDKLGLEKFAVVATSSGGTVGFHYASRHPDRVSRLVLINSAGLPRTAQTDPLRERSATAAFDGMDVRPREFWEIGFSQTYIAPNKVPDWILDMVADMQRREGLADYARTTFRYETGDPRAALAKVQAPTLIMWGKANPIVMHLEADVIEHWMTGAPTKIIKYEGLGHYPYIEGEARVLPDLAAFLAGEMDGELRRTARLEGGCGCE